MCFQKRPVCGQNLVRSLPEKNLMTKSRRMHIWMNFSRSSFLFFFFTTCLLIPGFSSLCGQQTSQPDTILVAPKKKKNHAPQKKTTEEPLVKPVGILTRAFQSKSPWQLLNPAAPDSYGNGQEMVSKNPDELGKENGLILFGVEW